MLIGFGINKENAHYLLSGYNTMSDKRKENFDIEELRMYPYVLYGICELQITSRMFQMTDDTIKSKMVMDIKNRRRFNPS